MQFRPRKKDPVQMDVTPLVDVVFLLLIFFMVTTTFALNQGIQVDLPQAQTGKKDNTKVENRLRIGVDAEGQIFFQGVKVTLSQLKLALTEAAGRKREPIVQLQADTNSSHGRVIAVMDIARSLHLNRFRLVTKDSQGPTPPP